MNIRLVIVTSDMEYAECFSDVIADNYKNVFKMSICSSAANYKSLSDRKHFDIALVDGDIAEEIAFPNAKLCAELCDESGSEVGVNYYPIQKYQRISHIVSELLEQYSKVANSAGGYGQAKGRLTAVWSPVGGVGKTSIAMAYAAGIASEDNPVIYLDLEPFSSTATYFHDNAKSISSLFEGLGGNSNMEILIAGLLQKDTGSGILYFGPAINYDDLNILTISDLEEIIDGCVAQCSELVVDLSSSCDEKTRYILERADRVLAVADDSVTGKNKWSQFQTQHSLYGEIADKMTLVANKGADVSGWYREAAVSVPFVRSQDPVIVYKTLSVQDFDE